MPDRPDDRARDGAQRPRSGSARGAGPRGGTGGAPAGRSGGGGAPKGARSGSGGSAAGRSGGTGAPKGARTGSGGAASGRPSGGGAPGSRSGSGTPAGGRSGAPRAEGASGGRPASRGAAPGGRDRTPTTNSRAGATGGPTRPARPPRDERAGDAPRGPRAGGRTGSGRPATGGARPPRPGNRPEPRREERPRRPAGPALPPGADPALVPHEVRRELKGIPDPTAETISAHLVAAGLLVDEDPAAAYEHAKYAKTLASRVGAVREAVGVTAYRAGDYGAALTELKAARRITGLPDHLPLIADCERALGHPDKALAYASDPDRVKLDRPTQVELAIVLSGARRDLGQPDAAVLALQGPELDSDVVEPWSVRLWYAYADALLAAGRTEEAASWFTAVAAIDEEGETDAEERLAELGG